MSTSPRKWLVRRRRLKAPDDDAHPDAPRPKVKVVVARRIRPGQTLALTNGRGSVTLAADTDQIETVPETVAMPTTSAPPTPSTPPAATGGVSQVQLYQRHLDQIAQTKTVELDQMRTRLSGLLCGEALLATREARIMERWRRINQVWERTRRRLARQVGVSRLSMDQGADYREKLEALHLLNAATPLESKMTSPASWKMTLRGETSTFVPIGNIFSGLFCEVKSTPPAMIETIRRPTPGVERERSRPPPAWKTSAAYRQRFHELRHRIAAVRPHEIVQTEALEIVGQDLFDLRRSPPAYSSDQAPAGCAPEAAPEVAAPTPPTVTAQPLIVRLRLSASELRFDLSAAQSEAVARVVVANPGTAAVHCRLRPTAPGHDARRSPFQWVQADFTLLPGQRQSIAIRFGPARPGLAVLALVADMFPPPIDPDDAPPVLLLIGIQRVAWAPLQDRIRSWTTQLRIAADRVFVRSLVEELAETAIRDRIRLQGAMRSLVRAFVVERLGPLCELRADLRRWLDDLVQRRVWPRCQRYDQMRSLIRDLVRDRVAQQEPVMPLPTS